MGTFLSITNEPLREAESPQTQRKNKKKTVESWDIWLMFCQDVKINGKVGWFQ